MRIKKFRCIQCGGPKVNPYTTPYIVCDFCGSFTDIDFAVGIETWNENAATTAGYQLKKMELMTRSQNALARRDRDEYYRLQYEYWDFYYRSFPAYLPPTIDTGEKYALYLEICAVSSVESAFDPKWQTRATEQQHLQNAVQYLQIGGATKAESASFFTLANFFINMTKEAMREFYENPRYAAMHELLPETLHLKMRSSMFVQAWLPYLTDADADKLLKILHFSNEYVEIESPTGQTVECGSCKTELFAPEGSYRVFCERCRRTTTIKTEFFCMSCGSPNTVPDNPGKPIGCSRCGVTNRLIRAQFG